MLKINTLAKDFSAKAVLKEKVLDFSLKDFKGKKIVLYFYPKDMTSGCTSQANDLTKNYKKLKDKNIEIIGVSKDSPKSHLKFIEKEKIPFYLVSDEGTLINQKYGVWTEKSMYGKKYFGTKRTTFLIDENFKIVSIIDKVDTKNHYSQIIDFIENKIKN